MAVSSAIRNLRMSAVGQMPSSFGPGLPRGCARADRRSGPAGWALAGWRPLLWLTALAVPGGEPGGGASGAAVAPKGPAARIAAGPCAAVAEPPPGAPRSTPGASEPVSRPDDDCVGAELPESLADVPNEPESPCSPPPEARSEPASPAEPSPEESEGEVSTLSPPPAESELPSADPASLADASDTGANGPASDGAAGSSWA
jgi:hypothetical protein